MNQWWDNLLVLEKFFYFLAVPSTLILVIQFIFSILGLAGDTDIDLGDIDSDFDLDMDVDMDTDFDIRDITDATSADFQFVSFRSIIAFLTIFPWTGIVLISNKMNTIPTIVLSVLAGLIAMFVIGYLFYATAKLQSSGNISYKNAIGSNAEVYIPMNKENGFQGKIQVLVQERLVEVNSISKNKKTLKTGEIVNVIDIVGTSTLIVEARE